MHNPQLPNREAAIEALEMAHALIQEAKGFGDGSVTDHLDAAENWLDKIGGFLALIPSPDQGETAAKPDAGVERLIAEWGRLEKTWHDALPQVQGDPGDGGEAGREMCQFLYEHSEELRAALATPPVDSAKPGEPIPMLLWCPNCHQQHIDEPDERTPDWSNPPHRSHLCHACGCIWRPADVATEGVRQIGSTGKVDTWPALPASLPEPQLGVD